ncbi:hypothetical protein AUF16_06255 [Enterococcus avium]|nr:hypothetical protein AUF16_06255 [Enterococcus avium]
MNYFNKCAKVLNKNKTDLLVAILLMRPKTIQLCLEIANEVERVQSKDKKEVKEMVKIIVVERLD